MNTYEDIELACHDCRMGFTWTAGEQKFMQGLLDDGKLDFTDKRSGETRKGQITQPIRCPECRILKKLRIHFFSLQPDKTSPSDVREKNFRAWLDTQSEDDVQYILSNKN